MNITYLIGAGASFHALPIVEKIPERLAAFANDFDPGIQKDIKPIEFFEGGNLAKKTLYRLNSHKDLQDKYFKDLTNFHKDIVWLKDESSNHSSVDTFAKKLFLSNKYTELKKLKYILSCFFLYEQTYNFDKRYDSFFASILENLARLPKEMKILSWNYDSQFEIAFKNFQDSDIETTRRSLNILTKENNLINNYQEDKFSIFKLNGTTNLRNDSFEVRDLLYDFNQDETSLVESFLELYENSYYKKITPNLSFAWENFKEDSPFNLSLKKSVIETDILIVIGYSFPFFNRKIDRFILESMPNLKKIYVQDPFYADDIIEKIKGLIPNYSDKIITKDSKHIEFFPKTFADQFFIPIEF
uniref:hypothetical protein n=1 Tax=Gelidibacter sp. TaxID=2018083 RepID=UPI004048F29E